MQTRPLFRFVLAAVIGIAMSGVSQAHFLWLLSKAAGEKNPASVHLYFSESAEPDDPALLGRLGKVSAWRISGEDKQVEELPLSVGEESLTAALKDSRSAESIFIVNHAYGVMT